MLSMRESPILYAARGQAQVCVNLYVTSVPEGGMDLLSIKISTQYGEYVVKFHSLRAEPKFGAAIDMSKLHHL